MSLTRICPVCTATMLYLTDGHRGLVKCIKCKYSSLEIHSKTLTEKFLLRKGYYEMYQPLDEHLYNILVENGFAKADAAEQVARDLGMGRGSLDTFLNKVERLDNVD
jgi:hypothetical protein